MELPALTNLVIVALAVYRMSTFIAFEEGPFHLGDVFRDLVGTETTKYKDGDLLHSKHFIRWHADEQAYFVYRPTNVVAEAVYCPRCNSFWLGVMATASYSLAPETTVLICIPFALSAFAILVHNFDE